MNKKVLVTLLILVLIGISVYSINASYSISFSSTNKEGLKEHGAVYVYKNGELVAHSTNIITTRGKLLIQMAANGTADAYLNNLTVANNTATQVVGDVELQGAYGTLAPTCTLAGATATLTAVGAGNQSLTYQWTSGCNNAYVNATGIYNATGTGNLFAETTWTPTTTLQSGDKLNVTYYWWIA